MAFRSITLGAPYLGIGNSLPVEADHTVILDYEQINADQERLESIDGGTIT